MFVNYFVVCFIKYINCVVFLVIGLFSYIFIDVVFIIICGDFNMKLIDFKFKLLNELIWYYGFIDYS